MKDMPILHKIWNLLFPARCVVCNKTLEDDERQICLMCNIGMSRYENGDFETSELAKLFYTKVDFVRAGAFIKFYSKTDTAKIFYSKYYGNSGIPYEIGRMAAAELSSNGFFEGIDAIVPAPLTVGRQLQRGYNQSERFARGISKETGIPVLDFALARTSFVRSQTTLSYAERQVNVEQAFHVIDPALLANKHILVVDDIITTGATTVACATEIKKVPGTLVSILGLGRTSYK